jgi:DNA repair protein RadC
LFRPCFEGLDREHFLVCGLDAKHRVIGINVVSVGTLTLSIVHPREVFKPLIVMNAAAWLGRGGCGLSTASSPKNRT